MGKNIIRHNMTNSAIVGPSGKATGIYRRCPHCGLVDLQHSVQGANRSHHQITRVGALLRYECGKCRKQFFAVEVCVPADSKPLDFYEHINTLLSEAETTKSKEELNLEHT